MIGVLENRLPFGEKRRLIIDDRQIEPLQKVSRDSIP